MRPEHDRKDAERTRSAALGELEAIRAPLLSETSQRARDPEYYRGQPPHACCTREQNTMRISPLEAQAIAAAFRREPELRRRKRGVIERLRRALVGLRETEERQHFDCPLLEGTKCLVHDFAKPIGCAAWHPPEPGGEVHWTRPAWRAFEARDRLNDAYCGPDWKLRAIPLALRRVFRRDLERPPSRPAGGRPDSPGRAERRAPDTARRPGEERRPGAPQPRSLRPGRRRATKSSGEE